jgi:prepilin-type N-terminal cleavage/methylation domain-containing protein
MLLHAEGRRRGGPRRRAFTLLELLVAVGISVVLLAILAFVFRVSTAASRDASSRISILERFRSLNTRMRQEVAGMVYALRGYSNLTYFVNDEKATPTRKFFSLYSNVLVFATSTVQDGRSQTVDVAYVYVPGPPETPEDGILARLRDATGPDNDVPVAQQLQGTQGQGYKLGDDLFIIVRNDKQEGMLLTDIAGNEDTFKALVPAADVMLTNVRDVKFYLVAPPPDATKALTQLNPRTLPAGIRLVIAFGPEVGEIDLIERQEVWFAVPRGL